ncbi:hypothetical protein [Patulibacter defluvii]|uniref:hypothetical protein n=1 Tax=Patulibacter defluvii TaxID=3095358 RepID=UPI002A760C07|nr:hypothetical protein [Patulibacter sp. DM4]
MSVFPRLRRALALGTALACLGLTVPAVASADPPTLEPARGDWMTAVNAQQCARPGVQHVIYLPGFIAFGNDDTETISRTNAIVGWTINSSQRPCVWVYRYSHPLVGGSVGIGALAESAAGLGRLMNERGIPDKVDLIGYSEGGQVANYAVLHGLAPRVRHQVGLAGLVRPIVDIHDYPFPPPFQNVPVGTGRINLFYAGVMPAGGFYFSDLVSQDYWRQALPGTTNGEDGRDNDPGVCYYDQVGSRDQFFGEGGRGEGAMHKGARGWAPLYIAGVDHGIVNHVPSIQRALSFLDTPC